MSPFKNLLLHILFYFSIFTEHTTPGKAIIIMGASCSGKSTLSTKLLESLGNQWKLVELDLIEDEFKALGKDTADRNLLAAVVARSNSLFSEGYNVIIDTNIYDEVLRTISTNDKKLVLVYCPLNILLERNAQRDVILKRPPQRADHARKYVEKTFYNFENFDKYDIRIDSSTGECFYINE